MAKVSLKQLAKRYGDTSILHGVDLDIADGELVVFVGPSGCGKSTLLRMIAGLEEISGGELHIGERIANDVPPARRGIAMVFQSYALYPHMTVFDNMAFALQLARHAKADIKQAVERAADTLQITHLLQRKPKDLSGGQRQRVAIGRAIVRKPEVFLFDEPLSNLDASLRVQMRVELSRLHRELGTTMIYVTHDQVEAMTLGQRIVVINQGRIEQVGTPFDLYNNPGNLFVAGFLGSPKMNLIPAQVEAVSARQVRVRLDSGAVVDADADGGAARVGDQVTLGVRAEHLSAAGAETGNRIELKVGHVEYLGDQTVVYASLAGCPGLIAARMQAAPAGSALALHLPASHCHLFDAQGRSFKRSL